MAFLKEEKLMLKAIWMEPDRVEAAWCCRADEKPNNKIAILELFFGNFETKMLLGENQVEWDLEASDHIPLSNLDQIISLSPKNEISKFCAFEIK